MTLLTSRPGIGGIRLIDHDRHRIAIERHIMHRCPCSVSDLSLCLSCSRDAVRGHLVSLAGQHFIEECYYGGKNRRVVA
jgi:predicted ArsR family transcriptional regulator